ncbi:hypothetical protein OG607_26480 [Streptomyces sp. NBC_01537]|uniref:hypothetical protein n=1 Tax=Streptomyces sp. NBC_01537 TaxID=2903896 RepID=UPI0038637F2E
MTVQAVADRLDADRKAIRDHVTDRETLLRLVALDALLQSTSDIGIPADCSWQEACRMFARAFADSVIATDALAEHLRLDSALVARLGEPTEGSGADRVVWSRSVTEVPVPGALARTSSAGGPAHGRVAASTGCGR